MDTNSPFFAWFCFLTAGITVYYIWNLMVNNLKVLVKMAVAIMGLETDISHSPSVTQ